MRTGVEGKPAREFSVRWSEKIYRLHESGVNNHGPRGAGIFEIVLFPPGAEDGEVLYVGQVPAGGSIAQVLDRIRLGEGGLDEERLAVVRENMANAYFDALVAGDLEGDDDFKDVAWALVQEKKPRLNPADRQPHSGRYSEITLKEV